MGTTSIVTAVGVARVVRDVLARRREPRAAGPEGVLERIRELDGRLGGLSRFRDDPPQDPTAPLDGFKKVDRAVRKAADKLETLIGRKVLRHPPEPPWVPASAGEEPEVLEAALGELDESKQRHEAVLDAAETSLSTAGTILTAHALLCLPEWLTGNDQLVAVLDVRKGKPAEGAKSKPAKRESVAERLARCVEDQRKMIAKDPEVYRRDARGNALGKDRVRLLVRIAHAEEALKGRREELGAAWGGARGAVEAALLERRRQDRRAREAAEEAQAKAHEEERQRRAEEREVAARRCLAALAALHETLPSSSHVKAEHPWAAEVHHRLRAGDDTDEGVFEGVGDPAADMVKLFAWVVEQPGTPEEAAARLQRLLDEEDALVAEAQGHAEAMRDLPVSPETLGACGNPPCPIRSACDLLCRHWADARPVLAGHAPRETRKLDEVLAHLGPAGRRAEGS